MKNRPEIVKAFRQARIVGEQLLEAGKIAWEDYAGTMVGFELELKNLGVNL